MKTAQVTITGTTPLLMHADNIEWADKMDAWRTVPANKAASKPGDDRTPAWRWIGALNFDQPNGVVTVPSEYIMASIMGGAAKVPTGKGQTTFKSLSQSGLLCAEFHWPLLVGGQEVPMPPIQALMEESRFHAHVEAVRKMRFSLFTKRVVIGKAKHIRVRPRFDNWTVQGEILITDSAISLETLQEILTQAGRLKGLGDWRPGAPHPGPFGMFQATVTEV